MEKMKNGVIYARQSYGAEENALSVMQQIERCKAWAARNNVEIKGIFTDNNTSSELYPNSEKGKAYCATDIGWQRWRKTRVFQNRKQYRQGLADAFAMIESQPIDYFIVDETTRFYRNPSATSQLDIFCIVILQEAKTALVNVTENKIDYLESNINIAMWRAFAQYEMEKVNEKATVSRANRKANIEKGLVYSNAYGIDWINKQISYNAQKAKVIRYIFESVINGKTYGEIVYTLNSVYKHLADGKCFYLTSIFNIIKNPIYSGFKLLSDGRYIEIQNLANQPPVSFTAYKKANAIVNSKKDASGKQKYNVKDKEKRNFLPFSGLLKCGNCGSKLVMAVDNGVIYFCKNTHLQKDKACTPSRIRFNFDVDNDDFLLVFQPLFIIKLYQYIHESRNVQAINQDIDSISADVDNIKIKIKTITETFLNNELDADIFQSAISKAKQELVAKENKLLEMKAKVAESDEKDIEKLNNLVRLIQQDSERIRIDDDDYSRLLRETVKEVIVYSDYIKIFLYDGNSFDIPRTKGNRTTKALPFATSETFFDNGKFKHVITYFVSPGEKKTILNADEYRIDIVS